MNSSSFQSTNILNYEEALRRVDGDREFLRSLIDRSLERYPTHRESLQRAVECNDMKEVSRVAHTVKGIFLNMGAHNSAARAKDIEVQAPLEGVNSAQVTELLNALDSAVHELEIHWTTLHRTLLTSD